MKKILFPILFISLLWCNISCHDYLDIVPEGVPSIDNAFSNRANAKKYLYTCYSYLPHYEDAGNSLGFLTGEEYWLMPKGTGFIDNRVNLQCWEIARGTQNSNNPYMNFWDGDKGGTKLWNGIRDCNIFLENIHKPIDLEDYERDRWYAEVTFLKAFYHFYLMQLYGPIPIMDKNVEVNAPIEEVRRFREPFEEVVTYVVNTLDSCMENLPLAIDNPGTEMGRITRPIAAAVKAQALLFAASPLMNGNPDYAEFKDSRGVRLFPAEYDPSKWKKAADATLAAIQLAEQSGHKLYKFEEALKISETTRTIMSIGEAVTGRWNKEIVWGDTRNVNALQGQAQPKLAQDRVNYYTRSVLSPTFNVVEGFYSCNGVPLEEDRTPFWAENYKDRYKVVTIPDEGINKYVLEIGGETALMHLNRELRFYSNLAFDRGTWYSEGHADDVNATFKLHFLAGEYSGKIGTEDYSISGYCPKKVCSYKNVVTYEKWEPYRYAFPIIRLADLYLMYAEALNETLGSPNESVYEYVDMVRERAGLEGVVESWQKYSKYPTKPASKEGMRSIIHKERMNELALEGKRFWDLRRWKVELPSVVKGWNIQGKTPQEFYRVTTLFERPKYIYRDYLWPLKIDAILKNPNLVQNPGWN